MKILQKQPKRMALSVLLLMGSLTYAQIGINTQNPQSVFHVDGAKDNPVTGIPTAAQQLNDLVVTSSGKVGIGTNNPSGALDVQSQTGGFVPPRMTTAQRNAISSPATGTMVYDTTLNQFYYYSGIQWESLVPVAASARIFQIIRKNANQTIPTADTSGDITFDTTSGQGTGVTVSGSSITLPAGKTFLVTGYLAIASASGSTQSWARYEIVDAALNNSSTCTVASRGYSEPSTEVNNDSSGGPALCVISTGTSAKNIKLRITAKRNDANVVTTSIADPYAETAVLIQEL
ncbi:hypothetical protein [uncultured Chryseobacterium sp.]|uniref:hypothetical protein n=1 Tax=uncultured Chryseobacterium sp. TaxID=259322 RepID=UPI0025F362E3|nr:hypothetical protein [uncultured Chryseobacterium sp.]